MSDFLMAIWADRNTCKPYTGPGRIGHVVRVSDNPKMTIINEFTDGGAFEHEDCAPASLQSWFIDRGRVKTTVKAIEQLAGTNTNGTGFTGIIVAGDHFGLEIKFSRNNPTPGYIMNPGGFTSIVDISEFPSYLAATQGGCLVLPNIAPLPPPIPVQQPTPVTSEDDPMLLVSIQGQTSEYLLAEGIYVAVYSPADAQAMVAAGAKKITVTPQQHERILAASKTSSVS